MNFRQWHNLIETKLLNEDFKTQREKFIGQGFAGDIVDRYLAWFKEIKQAKYKEIFANLPGVTVPSAQRINIDAYPTFHELETIVDYVKGQKDITKAKFTDVKFSGKPIYNQNGLEIYYAPTPRACIQYKGSIPYSWCIARKDASNMFYTYRFKEHEPAFYFIKDVDKTNTEFGLWNATKTAFSGQWRDKYHFFVVQVVKNSNLQDLNSKQYIVTSAQNDGDKQMSWNDLLRIEPKLNGLQNLLAPQPLSIEEKEDYNKFKDGVDDETFAKLDYNQKNRYLDIAVRMDRPLSDAQFAALPEDLKNKYIGFGIGLSNGQYDMLKNDNAALKRYDQITVRKIEEIKKEQHDIVLKPSEINIWISHPELDYMGTVKDNNFGMFAKKSIISNINEEGLNKLNQQDQNEILKSIVNYGIPITDIAVLNKIIQLKEEYLSSFMIGKIINVAQGDEAKLKVGKYIVDYKKGGLTLHDINALLMATQEVENQFNNYRNEIAAYIVQNQNLDNYDLEHILELSGSDKLAHLILAKYGKNISHEVVLAILHHVPNSEVPKLAMQMKDKLSEDELRDFLRDTGDLDQENVYKILGHHAQALAYPNGHSWVMGREEDRMGTEPYYLIGPDGKIKVKITIAHNGASIWQGGKSVHELMDKALTKHVKDWDSFQDEALKEYEPPSKWNDYIVDFIIKKPEIVKSLAFRWGAWSIGTLTPEQRQKLFSGRPDLMPEVNMKTSDGELWVKGTGLGKTEGPTHNEFTLLWNYMPVLIFTLRSEGNFIQHGLWINTDPTEKFSNKDPKKYSLATTEFILHNNIEHIDTRDKTNYGWTFDALLPEHQKMILAKYPDFLEPISFVKKISKDKKELLQHLKGFSPLELLDDNNVVLDKHDTIGSSELLNHRQIERIIQPKWASKILDLLDKKIHGNYGQNHKYDFEKLAKQGIEPLKEKFPFADEDMMNLAKEGGYKTADAVSHSIGEFIMPKVMQLLYQMLKSFENEEFKVNYQNNNINFTTSFENVIKEYRENKTLKGLEERYKAWRKNIGVDWEAFYNGIEQIERNADKGTFRNAITGVTKYPNNYNTSKY